jgi:hypothetical protein
MTDAENIKEIIVKFSYRDEAIIHCARHRKLHYADITEGVDSYTSIFVFKDGSVLNVDTQNYVYTSDETEIDKVAGWE